MISDERLAKIEELVCANLNEETIAAKVSSSASKAFLTLLQGGIAAVNARVYAVRVSFNSMFNFSLVQATFVGQSQQASGCCSRNV